MHIKNIHCIMEKLAESAKAETEKGIECLNTAEMGAVTDMLKDLAEAEYYAYISKAMDEAKKEEEEEDKYMLKRFREEYGDDDGKRYYDDYRYSNGRFAPKGRGTYHARRGYEEPPYYHKMPEMDHMEHYRDMDRKDGRMYYSGDMSREYGGMTHHDAREGVSGRSRRSYMESREINKGDSQEEKAKKIKNLRKYMNDLGNDLAGMISDASNEEKAVFKSELQNLTQMI